MPEDECKGRRDSSRVDLAAAAIVGLLSFSLGEDQLDASTNPSSIRRKRFHLYWKTVG